MWETEAFLIRAADVAVRVAPVLAKNARITYPGLHRERPKARPQLELVVVDGADQEVGVIAGAHEFCRSSETVTVAPQCLLVSTQGYFRVTTRILCFVACSLIEVIQRHRVRVGCERTGWGIICRY